MGIRSRLGGALIRLGVKSVGAGWAQTLGGMEDILRGAFMRPSKAGKHIDEETAFYVSTVVACVTRIAFGIAQVPWKVYRAREGGKGKDEARDHSLWKILHRKPNDFQTSFGFRVTMMFHLLFLGRFIAFVNRVDGKVVELLPLAIAKVRQIPGTWDLEFTLADNAGVAKPIPRENIWYIVGPSFNGWEGKKWVELARETIGLAMVAEENQIDQQKAGNRMPGVLSLEGNVAVNQQADLASWIRDQVMKDLKDTGILTIDRKGVFTPAGMSGVDSETLATRKFQGEEICRHFGMLPVMIGLGEGADGFASAEQKGIWHTTHTLDPWWVQVEQSAENELVDEKSDADKDISIGFVRAGMMRGSMKEQYDAFAVALGRGATGPGQQFMLPNEVREFLDMNPVAGWDDPAPFVPPLPSQSEKKTDLQ